MYSCTCVQNRNELARTRITGFVSSPLQPRRHDKIPPGPCAGPLHNDRGGLDGTGNVSVAAGSRSPPAIQSNRACTLLLVPFSHDEKMSRRIVSWLTLGVEILCGLTLLFSSGRRIVHVFVPKSENTHNTHGPIAFTNKMLWGRLNSLQSIIRDALFPSLLSDFPIQNLH